MSTGRRSRGGFKELVLLLKEDKKLLPVDEVDGVLRDNKFFAILVDVEESLRRTCGVCPCPPCSVDKEYEILPEADKDKLLNLNKEDPP